MKKLIIFAASAIVSVAAFASATIENVIVRQQWPWNAKVNIDFVLTDVSGVPHDISVTLKNCGKEIAYSAAALKGEIEELRPGAHRLVWDPTVDATDETPKVYTDLVVEIALADDAKKYIIIDVSGGSTATSYPITYLASKPEGGFAVDTYRTGKIVLRKIPAGTFVMGAPDSEAEGHHYKSFERQHPVKLSHDYYISVFPVTRRQYVNITGNDPKPELDERRPATKISYNMLRGTDSTLEANWPTLQSDGFFAILNSRVSVAEDLPGYSFDLPTSAQWEYACRAGTTTAWNNGVDYAGNDAGIDVNMEVLGAYIGNVSTMSRIVGDSPKVPNKWGIYDMHGGVQEYIRDWFNSIYDPGTALLSDPLYYSKNGYAYVRGGYYGSSAWDCRSAAVAQGGGPTTDSSQKSDQFGFRIACVIP